MENNQQDFRELQRQLLKTKIPKKRGANARGDSSDEEEEENFKRQEEDERYQRKRLHMSDMMDPQEVEQQRQIYLSIQESTKNVISSVNRQPMYSCQL